MARLTFGMSGQGLSVMKAVSDGLDQVAKAAAKVDKATSSGTIGRGAKAGLNDIAVAAKTTKVAIEGLVTTQEKSLTSLSGMTQAFNSAYAGAGNFSKAIYEGTAATKKMGADAAFAFRQMSEFALGMNEASIAARNLGLATYKSLAAAQAQVASVGQLEAVHGKYIATMARQIVMEDKGAQAIMAETAAINRKIAAMAKLQAMGVTYRGGGDALKQVAEMEKLEQINSKIAAKEREIASMRKAHTAEYTAAKRQEVLATEAVHKAVMDQFFAQQKLTAANRGLAASGSGVFTTYVPQAKAGDDVTKRLISSTNALTASQKTLHSTLRGVSGAMGGLWLTYGNMGPMLAGFAVAASTIKTVKLGAEFDATTRAVQFLNTELTGSKKPLEDIQQALLDMKDSVRTPGELAEGLLEFTRAGVGVEEVFNVIKGGSTVFEEMVRFSTYAGTSMDKTIKLITGQAAAFNTTFTEVANVVAKTADISTADISTMGEAFKNTTQLGTVLGVSFREVAAALGVMHDSGIRGATAGAALTTALIRISDPASKAKKILSEVSAEFSAFDAESGQLKSLPLIFEDLATATSRMNPQQFIDFMDELVGKRGVKAAGVLTKEAAADIEAAMDDISGAFGSSAEDVAGFSEKLSSGMQQYLKAFPEAVGQGAKSMTYLQSVMEAMSESGQYQLKMLKADVDRLFLSAYDNSSVVAAIKDLREVVNDPTIHQGLADLIGLVAKLLGISGRVGGAIASGVANKVQQVEDLFGGPDPKTISDYEALITSTAERISNVQAGIAGGQYDSEFAGKRALEEAQAAYDAATVGLEGLKLAQAAAANSGKSFEVQMSATKKQVDGAATALTQAENNFSKMGRAAKEAGMSEVDKVMRDMNAAISEQTTLINKSSLTQEQKNAKISEYTALVQQAYGPQMEAAKQRDSKLTADEAASMRGAAKAAKEQKAALGELIGQFSANRRQLEMSIKTTETWADAMRDASKDVEALFEQTATAGMTEEEKFFHERNQQLEDGMDIITRYTNLAEDAAAREAAAYADVEKAANDLAEAKRLLAANPAGGEGKDANEISKLEEAYKNAAEAARKATGARINATAMVDKAIAAERNLQKELYGTVDAYHEWLNAHAETLEKGDSFWGGMEAGASRLIAQYHTLGKLGSEVFDGLVDAGRTAASETADLLFDTLTGASEEATDALKEEYQENIQNLEESLREGTISEEEFQKERLSLTEQYNKDIEEAHKGLWEGIGDVMSNLFENALKGMLETFISWVAELAMIWAAKKIFSGTSLEGWANSLGGGSGDASGFLEGLGNLFGGDSSSGSGTTAGLLGAGTLAYSWLNDSNYTAQDVLYSGTYSGPDYSQGEYMGSDEFGALDAASTGKTVFDLYQDYNAPTTATTTAPTTLGTLGGAVGVVGGAYGMYSALQQLMNGQANAGTAVQGLSSTYSMYRGYQTVSSAYNAYMAGQTTAAVTEAATTAATTAATDAAITNAAAHGAEFAVAPAATETGAAAAGSWAAAAPALGYSAAVMAAIYMMSQNTRSVAEMQAPTLGGYIHPTASDDMQSSVGGWGSNIAALPGLVSDLTALGSGGDGGTLTALAQAAKDLQAELDGVVDILANEFGEAIAQVGMQLDGSVQSTDSFIDAVAGYDVALSTSADMHALAAAAADGQSGALSMLERQLMALGLSEQQARTAAMSLVAGVNGIQSTLSSATSTIYTAEGAISGMQAAVQELSDTPLNIRINTGITGTSVTAAATVDGHISNLSGALNNPTSTNYQQYTVTPEYHAAGGIFDRATLLPSINGYRHLVGEAGAEAITPLHAGPDTLRKMHDDIKAIGSKPVHVTINLDGKQIGSAVMPLVDAHVSAKAARNQLTNRTVY